MKEVVIYNNPVFTVSLYTAEPGSVDRVEDLPNLTMLRKKPDGMGVEFVYFNIEVHLEGHDRIISDLRSKYAAHCADWTISYGAFLKALYETDFGFNHDNFGSINSNTKAYQKTFDLMRFCGNKGDCVVRLSTGPMKFKANFNEIVFCVPAQKSVLEFSRPENKYIVNIGGERLVGYFARETNCHYHRGGRKGGSLRDMLNGNADLFRKFEESLAKQLPEIAPLITFEPYQEWYSFHGAIDLMAADVMIRIYTHGASEIESFDPVYLKDAVDAGYVVVNDPSKRHPVALTELGITECRNALRY